MELKAGPNRVKLGPNRSDKGYSMLRTDNRFSLVGLLLLMLCVIACGGFINQATASEQPSMDIQQSMDAFTQIDRWVREWETPEIDHADATGAPVSVAIVTLRLDGRLLGRGLSVTGDPDTQNVWQATNRAIRSASTKLSGDRDAMWDQYIADITSRITITLEIADSLVPIPESHIELPGFGYTPGVYGVAVRRGDQLQIIGPESMLARNTDMTQSAMAISNELAGDGSLMLKDPSEIVQSGYRFYRFEPIVLAQTSERAGASFIDRGGRAIDDAEIGMKTVTELASQISDHLINRQWPGVEPYGFMGTLNPISGKSEQRFADPFKQALGAYALLRYGSTGTSKAHRQATMQGQRVLRNLSEIVDGELTPWEDPIASCMALIALSEMQLVDILGDEELNTLREHALERLGHVYSDLGGFNQAVPVAAHGIVAHALVRAALLDPKDRSVLADAAIAEIFASTPATGLAAHMPFLGWALLEQNQSDSVVHSEPIRQMRELVWEHQLTREDLDWIDRDLAGGIVFTSSSTPLPSWIGLKPIACIASMLGDERVTPGSISSGEVPVEISRLFQSVRFIKQLCVDTELMHMYASQESAQGGVRRALWDQSLSVDASAMALLSLTEMDRSFKELIKRSSAESSSE